MSLISLLLALVLERARQYGNQWLWQRLFHWWLKRIKSLPWHLQLFVAVIVPSALVLVTQYIVKGELFGLLSLLLFVFIPLVTLGCPPVQNDYRRYLRDAAEGDQGACELFNQQLLDRVHPRHHAPSYESLAVTTGTQLIWLNYRYYFAIIFFYVVAGPAGAVFYACCRELHTYLSKDAAFDNSRVHSAMHFIDWLPARLASLALVLVGNANRALPVWLSSLKDRSHSNGHWLAAVAFAGSEVREGDTPQLCVETTCHFVSLAKRSIMLCLAVVSILTIVGWKL